MTDRTELERQIAELQAQLAAMDAEPHWEAIALVVDNGTLSFGGVVQNKRVNQDISRGLRELAALRRGMELAPRAAMDDAAVEALAMEVVDRATGYVGGKEIPAGRLEIAEAAIRATLSRAPAAAWPGEASSGYERGEWRNGVWHDQTGGAA